MSPYSTYTVMVTGLLLCRSCVGSHGCYEFMYTAMLSCPANSVLLKMSTSFGFYNLSTLSSVMIIEPSYDTDIPFSPQHFVVFFYS